MAGDETEPKRADATLPRDVQEHLGRRLRTQLRVEEAPPTFLGETSVPAQFEPLVRRLEAGERGERQGYEAVRRAILTTAGEGAHEPDAEPEPDREPG
ncbi:hypothetical protein [Enterovirga sp.]|jgi:hypothetical protein|uniref:hypothetical protein n=1 Tax=Enterovirga sp. TaxID=2026350 RepID=UPI00262C0C54|nr:hypothetical protein [Enterovirga sp.]MDB5592913.1 hypothetical protein [Enterovirga sp.]